MSQGRHDFPGAIHLIRVRGLAGGGIFFPVESLDSRAEPHGEHKDQLKYWEYLIARACDRDGASVHGYIWFPNEALLLLQRFARPLDLIMASVCGQFSRHLHKHGRVPRGQSPYFSRYGSIVVTPKFLPYAVRHLYGRAVADGYCRQASEYPFSSFRLHYADNVPPWFERQELVQRLERWGYKGREGGERFLLTPEDPRRERLFTLIPGRRPRAVGLLDDVEEAERRSQREPARPTVDEVIEAVSAKLRKQTNVPWVDGVLEKALVTWYATRAGAATLDSMGEWFQCRPTTLRANIESHRKRRPAFFRWNIERLLDSVRRRDSADAWESSG